MALPSGYTRLRYIQSSGMQCIDTEFIPNQDTRLVMKVEFEIQGTNQFLYGSRAGEKSKAFCFNCYKTFYRSHYNASWLDFATSASYDGPFVIDHNKNVTTLNGEYTLTNTYATFTCPYSLVLFAINSGGTIGTYATAKLYECQIYDNGTLVRDFVPAKNSGGAVGLYDTANGVLYTNAGTGTFTAGPLVTGPVDGEGVTILAGVSFAIKEGTAMLNGVARKITEGMTILEGAAKKIAVASGIDVAAMVIGYTGAYTDQPEVTMSGKKYRLLTLTGSGTLTVPKQVRADVWLCSGGNGGKGSPSGYGGGGGYFLREDGMVLETSTICTIGAGAAAATSSKDGLGGASGFAQLKSAVETVARNGASGGGGAGDDFVKGLGAAVSTVPFGETEVFEQHSAGGGGGGWQDNESDEQRRGGAGGSNGADGKGPGVTTNNTGGNGGTKGGGKGGSPSTTISARNGKAASFYGSGGGGGAYSVTSSGLTYTGTGGAGYQGVIYVRIPYEQ